MPSPLPPGPRHRRPPCAPTSTAPQAAERHLAPLRVRGREETGGLLPPVEQAILDRILAPAVAALSAGERQEALRQGRNQPVPATIALALAELTRPVPTRRLDSSVSVPDSSRPSTAQTR